MNDKEYESFQKALIYDLLTGICDQVKHEYDTEEEFEEKYGPTDALEEVVALYLDLKCSEDVEYTAKRWIESYPQYENKILELFELDRCDLGLAGYYSVTTWRQEIGFEHDDEIYDQLTYYFRSRVEAFSFLKAEIMDWVKGFEAQYDYMENGGSWTLFEDSDNAIGVALLNNTYPTEEDHLYRIEQYDSSERRPVEINFAQFEDHFKEMLKSVEENDALSHVAFLYTVNPKFEEYRKSFPETESKRKEVAAEWQKANCPVMDIIINYHPENDKQPSFKPNQITVNRQDLISFYPEQTKWDWANIDVDAIFRDMLEAEHYLDNLAFARAMVEEPSMQV